MLFVARVSRIHEVAIKLAFVPEIELFNFYEKCICSYTEDYKSMNVKLNGG